MGKPPWADRDLGAGRGRQRGDERTRDMVFTCMRRGTPGARRDLVRRSRTAREVNTGISGGCRRVGEMSIWMDDPRLGKLGKRSRCNIESGTV